MTSEDIVESVHNLAVELSDLDGMTARVFQADDWLKEREELRSRLETVRNDISAILDEI